MIVSAFGLDLIQFVLDLEGEMSKLNHILTEQKNLMERMTAMYATKPSGTMFCRKVDATTSHCVETGILEIE